MVIILGQIWPSIPLGTLVNISGCLTWSYLILLRGIPSHRNLLHSRWLQIRFFRGQIYISFDILTYAGRRQYLGVWMSKMKPCKILYSRRVVKMLDMLFYKKLISYFVKFKKYENVLSYFIKFTKYEKFKVPYNGHFRINNR